MPEEPRIVVDDRVHYASQVLPFLSDFRVAKGLSPVTIRDMRDALWCLLDAIYENVPPCPRRGSAPNSLFAVGPNEMVGVTDAAALLQMSRQGIIDLINEEKLTALIVGDPDAPHQQKTILMFVEELESLAQGKFIRASSRRGIDRFAPQTKMDSPGDTPLNEVLQQHDN